MQHTKHGSSCNHTGTLPTLPCTHSPAAAHSRTRAYRPLAVLQKARNGDAQVIKRLTWRQRLQMALEAATGMNYLHTNKPPIVHRVGRGRRAFRLGLRAWVGARVQHG